jgi:hypothetical protein
MKSLTEKVRTVKESIRKRIERGDQVKTFEKVRVIKTVKRVGRRPLKFGQGNSKLDDAIFTFSLPAGHCCPFAHECKSKADRHTGRITDGPHTTFRCFSASNEVRKSVREARWHNAELLRSLSKDDMVRLILDSLSPFAGYVRLHVSGDFFSLDYFDAWLEVARQRPRTLFYAYTKSLPFWVRRLDAVGTGHAPGTVPNFVLTASYGGTHDHLIEQHGLRYAKVVFSEQQAADLGLELDHDDSHAMRFGPSFALLLHGSQPSGTAAAKAVAALRAVGEFGYGERADEIRRERGRLPLAMVG